MLGLVMGQSALLSVAGVVIGLAGAMWTTRYLQGLLFGLTPLDPATFIAVALAVPGGRDRGFLRPGTPGDSGRPVDRATR